MKRRWPMAEQPYQMTQAEQNACAAIDFALDSPHCDNGLEAQAFLQCWREGDLNDWPEFKQFAENYKKPVCARCGDTTHHVSDCDL